MWCEHTHDWYCSTKSIETINLRHPVYIWHLCYCKQTGPVLYSRTCVKRSSGGNGYWIDHLIQGDRLIQVTRNTVQKIRFPVLIRSDVWPHIETFISGILIICENRQRNLIVVPRALHYLKLYEQVTPCDRLIQQVKTTEKVPLGLLHKWWPRPLFK